MKTFQIFYTVFSSIAVPFLLGSLQFLMEGSKAMFGQFRPNEPVKKLGMYLAIPFYPIYLIMWEKTLQEASKVYIIPPIVLEEAKYYAHQLIQVDIGLESNFQLIISTALLLLANSQTNTITGLEVLFANENFFYVNTKLALVLSISWSLFSCISSQINGMSKKREHSTGKSLTLLLLFNSVSIGLSVFSCILYLTPALGLFNSLRHLQGEMYPYWDPYFYPEDVIDDSDATFYYSNATPIPWSKITRWKYKERYEADPPELSLYTLFTIEEYFGILIVISVIQFVLQLLAKLWANPLVFQKLSWIDCLIHGICCCFVPCPMEEWDTEKGTIANHKKRKDLVFKEMLVSMILNFGVHLALLTPLIILGMYYFHYCFEYNFIHFSHRNQHI